MPASSPCARRAAASTTTASPSGRTPTGRSGRDDHARRPSSARSRTVKATNPYATDVHSHVLQVVVADLDKAFRAFFRRLKAGEGSRLSPLQGPQPLRRLRLQRIWEWLQYRRATAQALGHRPDRRPVASAGSRGRSRRAGSTAGPGKWFVSLACEVDAPGAAAEDWQGDRGRCRAPPPRDALSTGEAVENPRWYRRVLRRLRVIQRSVARKRVGGSNRRKAVRLLQRLLLKVANTRRDFLNKLADDFIKRFDRIVLEDLRVAIDGPWPLRQEHPRRGLVLPRHPPHAQGCERRS